jgi:hypothetical protein
VQIWLWFVGRGLLLLSARSRVKEFEVYDATTGPFESALVRIHDALAVVREQAPRRYKRMRQDVRRFVIIGAGGAEYWRQLDAIALTRQMIAIESPDELAVTIVHEATHARVASMGIPYLPALRERIERLCVREEVAFAKALPDGERWAGQALRALESPWWTDEAMRARRAAARRELRSQIDENE